MLENSTKRERDPSEFEHALGYVEIQFSQNILRKKLQSRRDIVTRSKMASADDCMRDIPKFFWPFISCLTNIFDDGNCGYRVVANFLY